MTENSAGKQRGVPFQKGKSGNPRGKPRGVRDKITVLREKLMQDDAKDVVQAVVAAATSGDMTAARLILERICPIRKGRPIHLNLPTVQTTKDIASAMAVLMMAMTSGAVTPDEAQTAASVFEMRRKALETEEFEQRLRTLEERTV